MTPTNGATYKSENGSSGSRVTSGNGSAPPRTRTSGLKSRREARIRMAVLEALGKRSEAITSEQSSPNGAQGNGLEASFGSRLLPPEVRKRIQGDTLPQISPAMMRRLEWPVNRFEVLVRLLIYTWAAIRWFVVLAWDRLRGLDSLERRAVRLRLITESLGGTAVKLGQQMAMRIDLLPYEYTVELSKMLDRMKPFPTEYAVERIETFLRKPLGHVFKEFDWNPIGSASVACVYSAYLDSGERVAIKVRRPNIGKKFMADTGALRAVLKGLEFLTVLRPGLSHNFLFEFRNMLLEELDFKKEARYTELFRRRVQKDLKFVSAPKIYHELSCEDILVTEFVEGIWLREMINAVERQDQAALDLLREVGISPELVAKRLLRANQFGVFENLLFHADPHPSNVVVQRDSKLVFIDFGACGAYTTRERNNWRQLAYYHEKEDVGRMVQSAVAILEPLPPIDIDEFSKRVEMVFWQDLYAFKSKHAEWWERTSAKIWINFLALAREYNIPLNLNTLRMIRSTLLYETIAARLYSRVDADREHKIYNKSAGKRSRTRVRRQMNRWFFKGFSSTDYLRIEQIMDMANRTVYLAQRWLDTPPFRFSLLVDKFVYTISVMLRAALIFVFCTLAGGFTLLAWRLLTRGPKAAIQQDIWQACLEVLSWRSAQFLIGLVLFLSIRRIMFRLFDKDVGGNTTGLS